MKIDAVELTLFSWDGIPPTRYTPGSQNVTGRSNLGLLRIATDEGIEGHAFLGSALNPAETDAGVLIRFLKPVLMGKDPLAREDLHAAMRTRQRSTGLRVIGACDTALWDIGAKAAGMPLYKFLGGGRAEIGAYASSQMLEDPQAYAQEAARFRADGWKGYKIHPPQSPREDIKVCEAGSAAAANPGTFLGTTSLDRRPTLRQSRR
jgi:L-alanine-DL-glutamate epimerase-like enolase superfamily enzyme